MMHKRCKECCDFVYTIFDGLCNRCNKKLIEKLRAENEKLKILLEKVLEYGVEGLQIDEIFASQIEQALKGGE
jgi:hypothetical protein